MSDREKAIQFCTDYLGSYGKAHEPTPKLTPALVLTMASALRAEEEREKGMEWEKRETSGGLLAICPKCNYPVSWWHKTPFCGNCGRKLDGGGQDG